MIFCDDILLPNSSIDEDTFYDMIEYVLETMEQFIKEFPETLSQQNFEEIFRINMKCMFDIQYFPDNTNNKLSFGVYEELLESYDSIFDTIYKYCQIIFHQTIIPRRSYATTFIRTKPNIPLIKRKLNYLINKPQPTQRTLEWYQYRHELITASNAWKVFESEKTQNQLICEKCKPLIINNSENDNKLVQMDSPLHWGNKYEDVSIMIYEHYNKTSIDDFGCIQHPYYPCLGASPDGICNDITSDIYGRMLEIKNVVSRQINGIPKKEYWIQMQLQMEVCNLNECDFLETKFIEYENENDFVNNGGFQQVVYNEHHKLQFYDLNDYKGIQGIIMCFIENSKPIYYYAPLFINYDKFLDWSEKLLLLKEEQGHTYFKTIYWKLEDISCVLVLRNKLWFQAAIPRINNLWDIIKKERVDGYEHRLPKPKKLRDEKTINQQNSEQIVMDQSLMDDMNETNDTNSVVTLKSVTSGTTEITMTSNSTLLNRDACQLSLNGIYNYTRSRSSTIVSDCDN